MIERRPTRCLLAGLALLTAACSSSPAAPSPPATQQEARDVARELEYTTTWEIRFGSEHVGYLVDVLPVPGGVDDQRPWRPGTALIEDKDLELLGFISPGGTTWRFDERGEARAVGFGTRSRNIAAFFRRTDVPQLVPVDPAAPSGG